MLTMEQYKLLERSLTNLVIAETALALSAASKQEDMRAMLVKSVSEFLKKRSYEGMKRALVTDYEPDTSIDLEQV